ncbi:MAG TPA: hypothetical protein VML54_16200 [Candidatus Limnocylindrales bacterium]|nr:hypothetical protein [Candidatus Limnocylindrales bacterium]
MTTETRLPPLDPPGTTHVVDVPSALTRLGEIAALGHATPGVLRLIRTYLTRAGVLPELRPRLTPALALLDAHEGEWIQNRTSLRVRRDALRLGRIPMLPEDTQRIADMLDTVDRKAHAQDDAPRLAALRALAPSIARGRTGATALDALAKEHGPRLAEIRGLLDRPATTRLKGFEKQQQIGAARRLARDIAGQLDNAEAIRRRIRSCEQVTNHTLAMYASWVTENARVLDGLAHAPAEVADAWAALEKALALIATWPVPEAVTPVAVTTLLPERRPASPRFATSATARPRGAA